MALYARQIVGINDHISSGNINLVFQCNGHRLRRKSFVEVSIVRNNPDIFKTETQQKALDDLDTGARTFDKLLPEEKGSLTKLEKKPDFEQWAESYVTPETFQVKNEGEEMDDMVLEPFEKKLRSDEDDTADQNDYIKRKQMFSTYMKNHPDLTHITINACSADENSDFTGFQIEKKWKEGIKFPLIKGNLRIQFK